MTKSNLKRVSVLLRPRITEKAAIMAGVENVYTFQVTKGATKKSVIASIKDVYNVTPDRVHLVNIPSRRVVVRGKIGRRPGGKKAYVHLKSGDKIEIM